MLVSSVATNVPGQALVAAPGKRDSATDPQNAAERQEGGHRMRHEDGVTRMLTLSSLMVSEPSVSQW